MTPEQEAYARVHAMSYRVTPEEEFYNRINAMNSRAQVNQQALQHEVPQADMSTLLDRLIRIIMGSNRVDPWRTHGQQTQS